MSELDRKRVEDFFHEVFAALETVRVATLGALKQLAPDEGQLISRVGNCTAMVKWPGWEAGTTIGLTVGAKLPENGAEP